MKRLGRSGVAVRKLDAACACFRHPAGFVPSPACFRAREAHARSTHKDASSCQRDATTLEHCGPHAVDRGHDRCGIRRIEVVVRDTANSQPCPRGVLRPAEVTEPLHALHARVEVEALRRCQARLFRHKQALVRRRAFLGHLCLPRPAVRDRDVVLAEAREVVGRDRDPDATSKNLAREAHQKRIRD